MLHAFAYNEVGIVVRHWLEIDLSDSHLEHGARIELRRLAPHTHRGTEAAAQRVQLDQPLWRADLFDHLDDAPGNFAAAHFHPHFVGVEPSERNWADAVEAAPWDWLERQLSDVGQLAAQAGTPLADPATEAELVRPDVPAIVAAARRRAPTECLSKEQCHAWTSDVAGSVDLMLERLQRPDLLDKKRVSPWLSS